LKGSQIPSFRRIGISERHSSYFPTVNTQAAADVSSSRNTGIRVTNGIRRTA
jgi:hypothetical protein